MKDQTRRGVLVIGHGSRRKEANDDVRNAARLIGEQGGFPLVEAAFLEIESPDIGAGFAELVRRGAESITVHPYFLSPGRHTRGDVPVKVAEASARHPGVAYRITEPLAAHRLVIAASVERVRETTFPRSAENHYGRRIREIQHAEKGKAYIVGAGPGDPGLLTVRARDLLASGDIVLYDYLVSPEILELVRIGAELTYVGKIGGARQTSQDEIHRLMIESAHRGRSVVRVKGGDPFIFGRGGEEAEALRGAGVEFEIVPGISSAFAAAAYAGIPLTHRGVSASVAVTTGVRVGNGTDLAVNADTLVVLMGVADLRQIAADLIRAGRRAETPVAVIRSATNKQQFVVTGTLRTIADAVESAGLRAPAVIVVGKVVQMREKLKWFEGGPARAQAAAAGGGEFFGGIRQ